jgi:DNA-binding transcriptional ArsR family regulator
VSSQHSGDASASNDASSSPDELALRIVALLGDHPHGTVEVAGDPILAGKLRAEIGSRVAEDETSQPAVVVDATGSPHVIRGALQRLTDHGLLILTAELRGTLGQLNYYEDLHRRGLTVVGI